MPLHALSVQPGDLQDLNSRMAKQFLELIAALKSISAHAREIAGLSREATTAISNSESDTAGEMLQQILADAEHMQTSGQKSRETLEEILSQLQESRAPLARLVRIPMLLNTVSMLTRVEGARVQSAADTASGIAGDISRLSRNITQHVESTAAEGETLLEMVIASLQQLNQSVGRESRDSADLIHRTREVLSPLQAQAEASRAAALKIDERYASIQEATNRIVMSIQTEDIARQQVEHIRDAVRGAAEALDTGAAESECAASLAKHRPQLARTRQLLDESFHTVAESLNSLGPRVEQLTSETTDLASRTNQDGCSFASAIEEGIAAVSSTFEQYSCSANAVVQAVETVVPSIRRMTRSAKEMSRIESAIRRTALNARIETAHLVAEGGVMKVISAEVQKIAEQSEADTRVVLHNLLLMEEALAAISDHSVTSLSSLLTSSDLDRTRRQLAQLAEAVMGSSQAVAAKLTTLSDRAGELQSELQTARRIAIAGDILCRSFDEVLSRMDVDIAALGGAAMQQTAGLENESSSDDIELF